MDSQRGETCAYGRPKRNKAAIRLAFAAPACSFAWHLPMQIAHQNPEIPNPDHVT